MNSKTLGLRVGSVIFGLVGLAHALRWAMGVKVVIGGCLLPMWPSVLALILAGGLSFWMWKLTRPSTP